MPKSPRLVHMLRNLLDPDPNPCVPTCAACREQGPLVMASRTDKQPDASLLPTDAPSDVKP